MIFRESFRLTASRVARDMPWSTLCKKSHGILSSPRSAAVAKFRLLTGHDCLCAHLFRFNLVTSPICVLCDTGQDMTAAHLDECSALNDLNCIVKRYKNDPDSVHELANLIIEERKYDESQQLELEKIREKSKLDLEIARIRANDKDNNTEVNCNDSSSLDSLIKSIRTLTVKISDKPEGWSFFFLSLERAFAAKSVTDKFKPEILLNLLGEKAANIIYLNDEDLKNYDKIKSIILQEFEPTPQSCLENFKKATRQNCESHVQFASRLTTNWEYYLKLRNVSNFEVLKQLIVSDKIFSTLDKETASHISVRQADKWFDPLTLGKEIDLFYSSRGKPLSENINYCRKNQNSKKYV
ncbi:integrase catalytic domain-containing protein [Trichonephila clavipes]|nr:integrase catalytic domain-containing protein [Trichonephila clavipes]